MEDVPFLCRMIKHSMWMTERKGRERRGRRMLTGREKIRLEKDS